MSVARYESPESGETTPSGARRERRPGRARPRQTARATGRLSRGGEWNSQPPSSSLPFCRYTHRELNRRRLRFRVTRNRSTRPRPLPGGGEGARPRSRTVLDRAFAALASRAEPVRAAAPPAVSVHDPSAQTSPISRAVRDARTVRVAVWRGSTERRRPPRLERRPEPRLRAVREDPVDHRAGRDPRDHLHLAPRVARASAAILSVADGTTTALPAHGSHARFRSPFCDTDLRGGVAVVRSPCLRRQSGGRSLTTR